MKVVIVHGIHTKDNTTWMESLQKIFQESGFPSCVWTYGHAYAILTRWQNPGRAKKLASFVESGDVLVGHSNGGTLAWLAAQLGAPLGGVVLLNPALDVDKAIASHVPWVNLYPNRHDRAVKYAKWLPHHQWGAQGRDGLSFKDKRYLTRFTDEGGPNGEPSISGHSAIIHEGLASWGPLIVSDVLKRINNA